MRTLTDREQRTIRIGGAALLAYLVLFGGVKTFRWLAHQRQEYQAVVSEARVLRAQVQLYQDRAKILSGLMENFRMDPGKLRHPAVVAEASAAIQKAAMSGGVQVGAVRESPGRSSAKELGIIQLEAIGPVPGLLKFLHLTESVGYPLVIESMQLGSEPNRPEPLKLSLVITVLDYDQWKRKEAPRA